MRQYGLRKRRWNSCLVWVCPPEYAHIIGVPFKTFKGGKGGVPRPPKPKTMIKALKERSELEIRFPNIVGYRSETPDGEIRADYQNVPKFVINFNEIPTKTVLQSAIAPTLQIMAVDLSSQIPYLVGTEEHQYMPDFIALVKTMRGEQVNLIIEISGFSDDRTGHKDAKRHYTLDYWLPTANNLGQHGRWAFVEVSDIDNIKRTLIHKIQEL